MPWKRIQHRFSFVFKITKIWLSVTVVISVIIPLIIMFTGEPILTTVRNLLTKNMLINGKLISSQIPPEKISFQWGLDRALLFYLFLTMILMPVFVRMFVYLWRTGGEEVGTKLKNSLQLWRQNLSAADKLYHRLYPPEGQPNRKYQKIVLSYTVERNGDAYLYREYHIKAVDKPISFVPYILTSSERTELTSLDLNVTPLNEDQDRGVTYLFSSDEPAKKRILVCFLPTIETTEKKSRGFKVIYFWGNFWLPLIENKEDYITDRINAFENVDQLIYEIHVKKPLALREHPEIVSPNLQRDLITIHSPLTSQMGFTTYKIEIKNAPAKGTEYRIKLSLR